jgi:hypothetical protein
MKDDLRLDLGQRLAQPLARADVEDPAVDPAAEIAQGEQRGLGGGRQGDAGDLRTQPGEPGAQPGAFEPGMAGDHHAAPRPEELACRHSASWQPGRAGPPPS